MALSIRDELRELSGLDVEEAKMKIEPKKEDKQDQIDDFTKRMQSPSLEEEKSKVVQDEVRKQQEEEEEKEEKEKQRNRKIKDREEEEEDDEEEEEESEETEDPSEEDEEEEEEDDDGLSLSKNKKKKSKTKGDQIRDLRASRDELKKKYKELESRYNKIKKSTTEEGAQILETVENKFGGLGSDAIEKINSLADVEQERDKLQEELESFKRDVNIKSTNEWKTEYEQPIQDALDTTYAHIVNTDDGENIPNKQYFDKFTNELVNSAIQAGSVNATQIKAAVNKFAKAYEEATGEEYIKPDISDLTKSIRILVNANSKANEAYAEWEKNSENRTKQQKLKEQEENEKLARAERKERKKLAQKALDGFDFQSIEDILDEEDIESEFRDAFKSHEEQLENPSQAMPYDEFLSLFVKGRLFDSVLKKLKDNSETREIKRKTKKGARGNDRPPTERPKEKRAPGERNWLINENDKQFGLKL